MPLILLGGITNRETMDIAMAEGFDFVAMGRALLAEPDLINRIAADGDAHTVQSVVHTLQPVHDDDLQPPTRTAWSPERRSCEAPARPLARYS